MTVTAIPNIEVHDTVLSVSAAAEFSATTLLSAGFCISSLVSLSLCL